MRAGPRGLWVLFIYSFFSKELQSFRCGSSNFAILSSTQNFYESGTLKCHTFCKEKMSISQPYITYISYSCLVLHDIALYPKAINFERLSCLTWLYRSCLLSISWIISRNSGCSQFSKTQYRGTSFHHISNLGVGSTSFPWNICRRKLLLA